MTSPPLFISVREAARALNKTPIEALELCEAGTLRSVMDGDHRSVVAADVDAYATNLIGPDAA